MRAVLCKGLLVFSLILAGFAGSAVLEPVPVEATTCPSGLMLAVRLTYLAGCTIGDKTFKWEQSSGNFPLFGNVNPTITVDSSPLNPGFTISLPSPATFVPADFAFLFPGSESSATGGALWEVTVNPGGQPIKDISMSLGGFSAEGDGTLELKARYPGGFLSVGPGGVSSNEVSFTPVMSIDELLVASVNAGFTGTVTIQSFTINFSEVPPTTQVPEPATFALLGTGLVGLVAFRRRIQ